MRSNWLWPRHGAGLLEMLFAWDRSGSGRFKSILTVALLASTALVASAAASGDQTPGFYQPQQRIDMRSVDDSSIGVAKGKVIILAQETGQRR